MSENTENNHQEPPSFTTDDLAHDDQAIAYLERHGADTVEHAFAIANILHIHSNVREASSFYRRAFELHTKSQTEYPLAQSLLQVRLLCLLKASLPLPPEEIQELENIEPSFANYIRGVNTAWREKDFEKSLKIIGNTYESFHSGEEIDRLYLEIALLWLRSLDTGKKSNKNCNIPHHLYMYWDRNPPLEIRENIQYHQDLIGEDFTVFDHESAAQWMYENYGREACEFFQQARHPAEAADLLRLHVIAAKGGWWLDADLRIKSDDAWDHLAFVPTSCQLFTTHNFVLHNDFFGAAPSHPIISNALLTAWANTFRHPSLYIAFKTGPGVLNRSVSRAIFQKVHHGEELPDVSIDNQDRFNDFVEEYEVHYKNASGSWHHH